MPEGDAVYRTARRLHQTLAGRALERTDFRVPRFATVDLSGAVTLEVVSRGKHLLHRLDSGVTVHSHLRMDGSWRVVPASSVSPRSLHRHTIRAVLFTAEHAAVGNSLGIVEVIRSTEEHRVVGHLGPDLLDPDWDESHLALAVANLGAVGDRNIAAALLDQSNLAGIGTIYASEPLFLCGVHPLTPVEGLTPDLLAQIVHTARDLMLANRDLPRTSTTRRRDADRATWVFGRPGRPCHRCETTIDRCEVVTAPPNRELTTGLRTRVVAFCPRCQPPLP